MACHLFALRIKIFFFPFPLANQQQKNLDSSLCIHMNILTERNRIFMQYITYLSTFSRECDVTQVQFNMVFPFPTNRCPNTQTLSLFCSRMGKYCCWVRVPGTKSCGLVLPEDKNMSWSNTKISEERNR